MKYFTGGNKTSTSGTWWSHVGSSCTVSTRRNCTNCVKLQHKITLNQHQKPNIQPHTKRVRFSDENWVEENGRNDIPKKCDSNAESYAFEGNRRKDIVKKSSCQCENCAETFVSEKGLSEHSRYCSGKVLHMCIECGKFFKIKLRLNAHIRTWPPDTQWWEAKPKQWLWWTNWFKKGCFEII